MTARISEDLITSTTINVPILHPPLSTIIIVPILHPPILYAEVGDANEYHTFEPTRKGDAGIDLKSTQDVTLKQGTVSVVGTGIRIASMPSYLYAAVVPRSGLAVKGVTIVNSPGTIDSSYRGEIKVIMTNLSSTPYHIYAGDRIAQLILCYSLSEEWIKTTEANVGIYDEGNDRGSEGFGSSGK